MHKAQMLAQVLAKFGETAERNEMPETAATPALEQSIAHDLSDRAIRRLVVGNFQPGGLHDPEALESARFPALRVRQNA
jgi:hypothetical protein